MYDLLIKGGRIYDGSGLPSHHGDVAIADGKIVETGRINGSAKRTLNVDGLAVAPHGRKKSPLGVCAAETSVLSRPSLMIRTLGKDFYLGGLPAL